MVKKYVTVIIIILMMGLVRITYASEADNVKLLIEQYEEFLQKKNIDLMSQYISNDIQFYRDFAPVEHYDDLHQHVLSQNEKCIDLKILPFDEIVASGNKVTTLYTLRCMDAMNVVHRKKIMSIAEFNDQKKVIKITQVSHDEK